MFVLSVAVSFIVYPLPFIYVSICVDECSKAICFIHDPVAVILTSILPNLLPITVFHPVEQISSIDGSIAESDWSVCLSLVIIHHLRCNPILVVAHQSSVTRIWHHIGPGLICLYHLVTCISIFMVLNLSISVGSIHLIQVLGTEVHVIDLILELLVSNHFEVGCECLFHLVLTHSVALLSLVVLTSWDRLSCHTEASAVSHYII